MKKAKFLKSMSTAFAVLTVASACSIISNDNKDGAHKCGGKNSCKAAKSGKHSCGANGCSSKRK